MKIALFSTSDDGGAGKAAFRLNSGLNFIGEDSTLFVKHKTTNNSKVVPIKTPEINNSVFEKCVSKNFFNNIYEGNTIASAMYPSIGFDYLERLREFDVINLHWIPTFVSLEAILKMSEMGKPIVWTLHDQNPMTGACHYTHGCDKYKTDCSDCPQLKENKYNVTKAILEAKIKYLPKDLVVVSPSRWLADCARESAVFKKHRIEVIPNSLETDIYKPVDKREAKISLGLPENAKVILFGAQDLKEKRKGLSELIEAVRILRNNNFIRELIERHEFYILIFGYPSPLLDTLDIPYKSLGYVSDEQRLALAYSAADLLALPSLEDNLPNSMLESMACGTPVVAFEMGGMSEIIVNGKNGYLAPLKDIKNYAERIVDVIKGPAMGSYCRPFTEQRFKLEHQGQRYRDLFYELTKNTVLITKSADIPIIFPEIANVIGSCICEATIETQNELDQLNETKKRLTQENAELLQERDGLKQERDSLKIELENVYMSRSWRITSPLRIGWRIIKKILKFLLPNAILDIIKRKN